MVRRQQIRHPPGFRTADNDDGNALGLSNGDGLTDVGLAICDDGERHAPFEHRHQGFEIRVVLQLIARFEGICRAT